MPFCVELDSIKNNGVPVGHQSAAMPVAAGPRHHRIAMNKGERLEVRDRTGSDRYSAVFLDKNHGFRVRIL